MVIVLGVRNVKGRNNMVITQSMTGQDVTGEEKLRYFKNGIEYVDIHEYAHMTHRTVAAVRASIEQGNRVRKMRAIRVGSRYYIPLDEYYIFPYINKGKGADRVYHFDKDGELHLCEECTNGGGRCPKLDETGDRWNGKSML